MLFSLISYTLIIFPTGYFFVTFRRIKSCIDDLYIKLVAGLIIWLLLSVGLAWLGKLRDWLSYLIILEWLFLFFYITFKIQRCLKGKISLAIYLKSRRNELVRYALSICLFFISLSYFGYVAWQMQWAPPGDAVLHSTITAIISETGKLSTPDVQINKLGFILHEFTFSYPPGFHLLAAIMALSTGVFPGQATVLLAAFISSLMPLLIFSMLMHQTGSVKLSAIGWAMTFILPYQQFSTWPQHDLLTANLLNGTYMAHLGNLFLLCLVYVLVRKEFSFRLYWSVVFCLILTYTGYFSFTVLWTLFTYITSIYAGRKVTVKSKFLDKSKIINLFPILFIVIFPIIFSKEFIYVLNTMKKFSFNYRIYGDWLPPFLSFPYTLVVVSIIFASLVLLLLKIELKLSVIFLSSTLVILGALNENLYSNLLFTTYPQRFFPVFVIIGYCVLMIFIANCKRIAKAKQFKILSNRRWLQPLSIRPQTKKIISIILFISFIVSVFSPYMTYTPSCWGRPTGSDYEVLKWISEKIPSNQLILNDPTFTGLFLCSFSPKYIVNIFPMPFSALPRANELNQLFYDPGDYELSARLFSKYDVRYVYVSSEDVYKEWFSENWIYKRWPPETYLMIFDLNPYLTKIFQKGQSAVYRVILDPSSSRLWSDQVSFEDCIIWINGTASVKCQDNAIFIRVNTLKEYGGISFTLIPPYNATGALIHLKASGTSLNKAPSIHGYVFYEDESSDYFHLNLDNGTYDWTGYAIFIPFDSFKKVKTLDVRVGMLWCGYKGELKLSNITVTWKLYNS